MLKPVGRPVMPKGLMFQIGTTSPAAPVSTSTLVCAPPPTETLITGWVPRLTSIGTVKLEGRSATGVSGPYDETALPATSFAPNSHGAMLWTGV